MIIFSRKIALSLYLAFILYSSSVADAQPSDLYCGEATCYEVLGVDRSANKATIRKAYHKLAQTKHPDKQKTQQARKEAESVFQVINTAYEILTDAEQRQEYDYMLDNPELRYYHYYRYFRRRYGPKVDVRLVILAIIGIFSTLQYIGQWTSYNQAVSYLTRDAKHRNKARELALSEGLLNFSKYEGKRRLTKEELKEKEDEMLRKVIMDTVELKGDCARPSLRRTLVVYLVMLPYTATCLGYWAGHWVIAYWLLKRTLNEADRIYLTRRRLGLSAAQWDGLPDKQRTQYLQKQLWCKEQFQKFKAEQAEMLRIQAATDSQSKRYRRFIKQRGPEPLHFDDDF